jgi:hypothetical protein
MQGFDRVRRPRNAGASRGGASYLPGMDLLEYQGKQLFRPVVVKAQVVEPA